MAAPQEALKARDKKTPKLPHRIRRLVDVSKLTPRDIGQAVKNIKARRGAATTEEVGGIAVLTAGSLVTLATALNIVAAPIALPIEAGAAAAVGAIAALDGVRRRRKLGKRDILHHLDSGNPAQAAAAYYEERNVVNSGRILDAAQARSARLDAQLVEVTRRKHAADAEERRLQAIANEAKTADKANIGTRATRRKDAKAAKKATKKSAKK